MAPGYTVEPRVRQDLRSPAPNVRASVSTCPFARWPHNQSMVDLGGRSLSFEPSHRSSPRSPPSDFPQTPLSLLSTPFNLPQAPFSLPDPLWGATGTEL